MPKLLPTLLILLALFTLHFPTPTLAKMSSDNYIIRFSNFNMTSGKKTGPSSGITLTDTVGQTAAGQFDSDGYIVKAGFQYIYILYPFSFSISDLSIDFGALTPGAFSTQTNTLNVSAPGAGGFSITAEQDHRLKSISSDFIPDTTCDSSCTDSSAAVWTNTANFGFGFNIQGDDVPSDFTDSTYFRQFADISLADTAKVVMFSTSAAKNHSATVTYKLNVSASQAAGDYENQITYIATPAY